MEFPVPWALSEQFSHLITEQSMYDLFKTTSLTTTAFNDWSEEALIWRQRQTAKPVKSNKNTLSPSMILGDQFNLMGKNVQANLERQAIRIVEIVLTR